MVGVFFVFRFRCAPFVRPLRLALFSRFSLFIVKVVSFLTSRISGVCFSIFSYFSLVYLFSIFLRVVVLWTVYLHYYPFESPDADIRGALSKFGQIKSLRYQSFPGYPDVKTGSRIIKMAVDSFPAVHSGFPLSRLVKGAASAMQHLP